MCPNRTFAYKDIPMVEEHHCMDNSTVCRRVKLTQPSCVHQIFTIHDFKIPRTLLNYKSAIIPFSDRQFQISV